MRRLVIAILATSLAACASPGPRLATGTAIAPGKPAEGLWAILDPGCRKPDRIDIAAWPKCASPFWISGGSAVVVRTRPSPGGAALDHSYRAEIILAGDHPLIAEVGNAMDGHLYLALIDLARDAKGRLVGAAGEAFVCAGEVDGPINLTLNASGCETMPANGARRAAEATLRSGAALSRVAWIAPGAP